jgi:membrane protein
MNISYEEIDRRNIVWWYTLSILFTLCGIVFFVLSLALIAAIPPAVRLLQPGETMSVILLWSRWPILAILVILALTALYRYTPYRNRARIVWITPGAVLASVLWLLLSAGFSFYVENFGGYGETFGALSAVVVMLMWFYLSAFVICLGAELNSELELQTYRDSTIPPNHRMGRRGAYVADHTAWDHPRRQLRGD